MPRIVIVVLVLLGLAGATAAFVFRPASSPIPRLTANHSQQNLEKQDLLKTREFLNLGKPEEAVAIIQEHADDIDYKTETGREWLDLLIRASEATLNIPQLLALNDYYSKSFDSHEKAALLIATHYLATNRAKEYQALRDSWIGRETKPEAWFVLDVDKLLGDGKRKEAIDLLHSRSFPGKSDSTRLIRLALLYAYEQPKTAWDYLTQAYAKDPENPDIRSYRAKLLETVGKMPLALSEYRAAIQADPQNPYLKDQLAEFFVRTEQYPEALQIWSDQIKSSSQDSTWLKALFWSRVAQPIAFDWKDDKVPQGKLEPLIRYLLAMQPGTFWNSSDFERLPEWQNYLSSQQATFWFRLLDDLKLGKEKEAYDLLQYNPFSSVSWNPKLEQELKRILQYRQSGQFARDEKPLKLTDSEDPYFIQIDAIVQTPNDIPHDLHDLLKGPEAFAMAFLAAGWNEAGLGLHEMQVIPPTYPDWVAVEIAKALRENRGDSAALKFATVQPTSQTLSLLIGETYLAKGNQEAALKYLSQLKGQNSDAGYRASWLLSLLEIERGQYEDAKAVIQEQPRLAQDVLGKETLARIALLEGDTPTAETLYISLEKVSTEAQSYLARKAFFDKDWKRARVLTENLLRQYPDNPMLQQNLAKIKEEQKKTVMKQFVAFLSIFLLSLGSFLSAYEPYHSTVTVDTTTVTVSAPNLKDLKNDLRTTALEELILFYTPILPVSIGIDFRGIDIEASFAADSTVLVVNIPQAGISRTFDGGSRDASIALFKEAIQDGGGDINLLKAYARFSPIDPIAGNPNSLMAQMGQADYLVGHLSPLAGCDECWCAQPIVHQFQAGLYSGRAFCHEFDTTTLTLPLRYSYSPDLSWAFIIDLPLTYNRNGGASSIFTSVGLGLRYPVTCDWSLTPVFRLGSGGSVDLCTAGAFISTGLTSVYNLKCWEFVFSLTNYVAYISSINLWLGGDNLNYHLHNYVFKNGIAITSCKGYCFCKRPVYLSVSFLDTAFSREKLFIKHYDEVGVSLITNGVLPCVNYDCLILGFSYQWGQKGYKAYLLNLAYQF